MGTLIYVKNKLLFVLAFHGVWTDSTATRQIKR